MNHGPSYIDDVAHSNVGVGVWDAQTCEPELPHDTAEDVFLEARLRIPVPAVLAGHSAPLNAWSTAVFRAFWSDWELQEGGGRGSRTFGDEAAIRLLHALSNSRTRQLAMKAECYLAVINKNPESQTQIAKKYGVTRAAISKIIISIRDNLDLQPARHMKSDTARESYRARAIKIHQQNKLELCKKPKSNSYHRLSTLRTALTQTLAPEN